MTRLEIIMACRGEYPENLKRTIKEVTTDMGENDKLTIVLDGKHSYTLEEHPQISVITPWQKHRGPGACRHYGITNSDAKYVLLIDGHMTFPAGCFGAIVAHLEKHPKDLTCCHMTSLGHDWKEPEPYRDFGGCFIAVKSKAIGNTYCALAAKWLIKAPEQGEVPAVMGACYGMARSWYRKLGEPLSILEGWGQDEEILSLATWICGGRCYLLPIRCGHVYAAPYHRDVSTMGDDAKCVAINRYAVLHSLPIPEPQKSELLKWLNLNVMKQPEVARLLKERQDAIDRLCAHLGRNSKRTWQSLAEAGILAPAPPVTPEQEARQLQADMFRGERGVHKCQPQVINRPAERCEYCNAINSFRKTQGSRDLGMFEQAYAKCVHCGHKARIRTF